MSFQTFAGTLPANKQIPTFQKPGRGGELRQYALTRQQEIGVQLQNSIARNNTKAVSEGRHPEIARMRKAFSQAWGELDADTKFAMATEFEYLRKSLTDGTQQAGFQTPVSGGDDLTPLIPQSIDEQMTELVFRDEHLRFMASVARERATNTVHEFRKLTSRGDEYMSRARQEGLTGSNSQSIAEYGAVQLKSYVDRREITDVLGSLTGIGVSGSMLSLETTNATMLMRQGLEFDGIYGDSGANPLEFDGVITSLVAQGNVTDMHQSGGVRTISLTEIEEKLRELYTDRYKYAKPTNIWAPPRVLTTLSKEINPSLRTDMQAGNRTAQFGASSFKVQGPAGQLTVDECQMMGTWRDRTVPTGNSVDDRRPAIPSVTTAAGANASSRFFAEDAGSYEYWVLAYNQYGYTRSVLKTQVVAAGERVSFTINDDAIADGTLYYQLWRTGKDPAGATGLTAQWIGKFARAAVGVDTVFYDYNDVLPGHFDVIITQQDKESLAFVQLLDMTRVPLAKVELTTPLAIFTVGALVTKAPEKMWVFRNIPQPSYG